MPTCQPTAHTCGFVKGLRNRSPQRETHADVVGGGGVWIPLTDSGPVWELIFFSWYVIMKPLEWNIMQGPAAHKHIFTINSKSWALQIKLKSPLTVPHLYSIPCLRCHYSYHFRVYNHVWHNVRQSTIHRLHRWGRSGTVIIWWSLKFLLPSDILVMS